jgi:hypothetical protein
VRTLREFNRKGLALVKPSRARIAARTGGVIKFRNALAELNKQRARRIGRGSNIGPTSARMLSNQLCGFCALKRTDTQVLITRTSARVTSQGRVLQKAKDIAWAWICSDCKAKVESGVETETQAQTFARIDKDPLAFLIESAGGTSNPRPKNS